VFLCGLKKLKEGQHYIQSHILKILRIITEFVYWNRGHPDNEIQSEGRTETIDSNIFKSSQSNVQWLNAKLKLIVLS